MGDSWRAQSSGRYSARHGKASSGVTGVSVECAAGLTVTELAEAIPHGHIGVASVGEVRQLGGEVIRTSGRSPYHATLTGLSPEQASALLTPALTNPAQADPG